MLEACFLGWEGSFVQNNEEQFKGNGEQEGKKADLLQVLKFFAVFVRGGGVLGRVLKELIHVESGVKWAVLGCFWGIM